MKIKDAIHPISFAALLLIIWQAAVNVLHIPPYLLPAPTSIFSVVGKELADNLMITLLEATLGFGIANILGFLVAVVFVHCRPLEKGLFPLAIALKTTPLVALAPLLIIWLGTGIWSKVVASALICFFPILVNSVKGLKAVEYEALELFKTYGASKFEIFIKLRLKNSLPYVMSALKISTSLSVVGAIVGEFVGANKGLGYMVMVSSYHLETSILFSAIFASAAIGLLLFWIVGLFEGKLLFWHAGDEL